MKTKSFVECVLVWTWKPSKASCEHTPSIPKLFPCKYSPNVWNFLSPVVNTLGISKKLINALTWPFHELCSMWWTYSKHNTKSENINRIYATSSSELIWIVTYMHNTFTASVLASNGSPFSHPFKHNVKGLLLIPASTLSLNSTLQFHYVVPRHWHTYSL